MLAPPSVAGAEKATESDPSPGVSVLIVGALGASGVPTVVVVVIFKLLTVPVVRQKSKLSGCVMKAKSPLEYGPVPPVKILFAEFSVALSPPPPHALLPALVGVAVRVCSVLSR